MEETSGVCLSTNGAGADGISQLPHPQKDQPFLRAGSVAAENLQTGFWNSPLLVLQEWEWLESKSGLHHKHQYAGEDNDPVLSRSPSGISSQELVLDNKGFSTSFFKPISNLLNSFRKKYQQSSASDMGNLQGSDKKGGGKNAPSGTGSASPGRSRANKLFLGGRGKSPAKQKNAKGGSTTAVSTVATTSAPPIVESPPGVTSREAAAAAEELSVQVTAAQRTSNVLQQRAPQQHLLPAPSRESSAESVFTDPLTSPINNHSATLAPASGSITSSYYSDAGTLPRDDTMVRTALEPDHTPPSLEERSPIADVEHVALTLEDPSGSNSVRHSLDALDEEEDPVSCDLMTRSVDTLELGSPQPPPTRTASQGAFTLVRHRKVELPPAKLPPEAAEHAQSELNLISSK